MGDGILRVNHWLIFFIIWVHIPTLYFSWMLYSIEKMNSNIFIPTNCQINQTITEEIPCPIRKNPKISSSEMNTLCKVTYYGIIYENNFFVSWDQLPTWFSPIDAKNLQKTPMKFSENILSKPMNISCYSDRLTHKNLRWTQPDPKRFLQLFLFSTIAICLTIIHVFRINCCQRRSNRR
jgi:hypothetical protein